MNVNDNNIENYTERVSVHISLSPSALLALDTMAKSPRKRGLTVENLILNAVNNSDEVLNDDSSTELSRIFNRIESDGKINLDDLGVFNIAEAEDFFNFIKKYSGSFTPPLPIPLITIPPALMSSPLVAMIISTATNSPCQFESHTCYTVPAEDGDTIRAMTLTHKNFTEALSANQISIIVSSPVNLVIDRPLYKLQAKGTLTSEESAKFFLWYCAALNWEIREKKLELTPIQANVEQLEEAYQTLLSITPPKNNLNQICSLASTAWGRFAAAKYSEDENGSKSVEAIAITKIAEYAVMLSERECDVVAPTKSTLVIPNEVREKSDNNSKEQDGRIGETDKTLVNPEIPLLEKDIFNEEFAAVMYSKPARARFVQRMLEENLRNNRAGFFFGEIFNDATSKLEDYDNLAIFGTNGNTAIKHPLTPIEGVSREEQVDILAKALFVSLDLTYGFVKSRRAFKDLLLLETYSEVPTFLEMKRLLTNEDKLKRFCESALSKASTDAERNAISEAEKNINKLDRNAEVSLLLRLDDAVEAEGILCGKVCHSVEQDISERCSIQDLVSQVVVIGDGQYATPASKYRGTNSKPNAIAGSILYSLLSYLAEPGYIVATDFDSIIGAFGGYLNFEEFITAVQDVRSHNFKTMMLFTGVHNLQTIFKDGTAYANIIVDSDYKPGVNSINRMISNKETEHRDYPHNGFVVYDTQTTKGYFLP